MSKDTSTQTAQAPTTTSDINSSLPPTILKPVAANTQQTGFSKAEKYYAFNETGNIMIATTNQQTQQLSQPVMDIFNEVSVFFAAMTKAITTTQKPDSTKSNPKYYSLYDYNAIQRVIDGSGCFVQVTREDLQYESNSFGASFNLELVASILGVVATGGAGLAFAESLISTIAKQSKDGEFTVTGNSSTQKARAGNITFVCEYLLGMPLVSAIVAYADEEEIQQAIKVGPCFKENSVKTTLNLTKEVYLFVTPTFIQKYSTDLDSIISDQQYGQFINYLQTLINNTALITGITYGADATELDAGAAMDSTTNYMINGIDFGNATNQGVVCIGAYNAADTSNQLKIISWSTNQIEVAANTDQASVPLNNIYIYDNNNKFIAKSNSKYSLTVS